VAMLKKYNKGCTDVAHHHRAKAVRSLFFSINVFIMLSGGLYCE